MLEFVECVDCEFVLVAADGAEPAPKRVDECPGCGATEFRFTRAGSDRAGSQPSREGSGAGEG